MVSLTDRTRVLMRAINNTTCRFTAETAEIT
jgi:hypothetical protein